jgi:predicted PurR-regulated permease PerM
LLSLGFPHWLALGVLAGMLEFIPIAGWMMAAITMTGFGLITHSHWIWMLALLGIWRVVMDYAISPRVMGHQLEIHPLLAIFTVMAGGAVGESPVSIFPFRSSPRCESSGAGSPP